MHLNQGVSTQVSLMFENTPFSVSIVELVIMSGVIINAVANVLFYIHKWNDKKGKE